MQMLRDLLVRHQLLSVAELREGEHSALSQHGGLAEFELAQHLRVLLHERLQPRDIALVHEVQQLEQVPTPHIQRECLRVRLLQAREDGLLARARVLVENHVLELGDGYDGGFESILPHSTAYFWYSASVAV